MAIDIGPLTDPATATIKFTYSASNPSQVHSEPHPDATNPLWYSYTLPEGRLRLWKDQGGHHPFRPDGTGRTAQIGAGSNAGDYIASGVPYPVRLLFPSLPAGERRTVTVFVEAVQPSVTVGEPISASVADAGVNHTDSVRVTAVRTRYGEIAENGNITPTEAPNVSHPTPMVKTGAWTIFNERVSQDHMKLLVDIALDGFVQDSASDLISGSDGTITSVGLELNGIRPSVSGMPLTSIQINTVQKGADAQSLLRPYPFLGTFSTVLTGVEVEPGWNQLRLTATNVYGYTGFIEGAFQISAQPPQDGVPPEERPNWLNFTIRTDFITPPADMLSSLGGEFSPLVVFADGPIGLRTYLSGVTIAGRPYSLVDYQDHLCLAIGDSALPRPLLVLDYNAVVQPLAPPDPGDGFGPTLLGIGVGYYAAGVGLVDGVVGLGRGAWHCVRNYNIVSMSYRLASSGQLLTTPDKHRLQVAAGYAERLGTLSGRVLQHEDEVIMALLTGDEEELLRLGAQEQRVGELAADLWDDIAGELALMNGFERGQLFGRIGGEISIAVVTAGGGSVLKGTKMVQVVQDIRALPAVEGAPGLAARLADDGPIMLFFRKLEVVAADGAVSAERALSVYERIRRREGLGGWQAFKKTIDVIDANVGRGRKFNGRAVLTLAHKAMDDAYAEATAGGSVDLTKVPTWREASDVMRGRYENLQLDPAHDFDFNSHHTAVSQWTRRMYELQFPGQTLTDAQLNEMPALLMPRTMHTGRPIPGTATFHQMLNARMGTNIGAYTNVQDILDGLRNTYQAFNNLHGAEAGFDYNRVWTVAREWLRVTGIP